MKNELTIHTDGGSRGNPGPSACAFVVEEGVEILHTGSKFLGKATNNHAEYSGVVLALDWLNTQKQITNHYSQITFFLDSELIVRQINGRYKVKDENLKKLHTEVNNKTREMAKEISFKNVPREQNKIADRLVNEILDKNTQ